jgi:hypothetical protein
MFELIQAKRFELLVLGHTLSGKECCKLASAFRAAPPERANHRNRGFLNDAAAEQSNATLSGQTDL